MNSIKNASIIRNTFNNAKNDEQNIRQTEAITKAAFPAVRDSIEIATDQTDTLGSQLKGWFGFDLGLKTIGLVYSSIKRMIKPDELSKLPTLIDRFFTPDKLGLELGKKMPKLVKAPLATLTETIGNLTVKEGGEALVKSGSIFKDTVKPLIKLSGAPFMLLFEMLGEIGNISRAFKADAVTGVKQLGKSLTKGTINAAAFCGGQIGGTFIGAAIGSIGGPIGAQIGGWIGGIVGGAASSYYSNKLVKNFIKPEIEEINTEQTPPAIENKTKIPVYA